MGLDTGNDVKCLEDRFKFYNQQKNIDVSNTFFIISCTTNMFGGNTKIQKNLLFKKC